MAGTKDGGVAASKINKTRYGDDFYQRIGAIGGRNSNTGGFAGNSERAREMGYKGWLARLKTMQRCECGVLYVTSRITKIHQKMGHNVAENET